MDPEKKRATWDIIACKQLFQPGIRCTVLIAAEDVDTGLVPS